LYHPRRLAPQERFQQLDMPKAQRGDLGGHVGLAKLACVNGFVK
jgi:hypothetical protein